MRQREILELSDGGVLALDWYHCDVQISQVDKEDSCSSSNQKPILAVVPGITGDGTKLYMIELVQAATKHGYDLVCINYRGQGGVPLKVSRLDS